MKTQKKQKGFIGFLLLIAVAAGALYFMKDEHGVTYFQKLTKKKEDVMKEVEGYKTLMKEHDKELEKNMK